MKKDPNDWLDVQDYNDACCADNSLKVTNDIAETLIHLIEEYNEAPSKVF